MCGIAGIIGKKRFSDNEIREYLVRLRSAIIHRGPDEEGEYIGKNCGFAHTRLSIVDIAGGHQPIFNDNKNTGIIYNGEVYNYLDLKKELEEKGHSFHTKTDTEVILNAYEEYGVEAFEKLNGMFSFCIWDLKNETTYLVRDPFGIKPLYIYEDYNQFIFASELKAILGVPGIDLSLDSAGFQDYLMFRYVQAPYTFFKKIRRIEAGTYLRIKNCIGARFRYWDISYKDPYPIPKINDVKEELSHRIQSAVKSQLMGDVPIGVLLSGGIDSSAIAYFIHKNGADLTTFNIGFPEVNEFEYSRAVAGRYGLKHIEIVTTIEEMINNFDDVILALDEPIADPACFPLYKLAQELKKQVTVVLSGEGGDELFAGYNQYAQALGDNSPHQTKFDTFMEKSWYFRNYRDFLKDPFVPPHILRHKKYYDEQPHLNGMLAYDLKTWIPENLMMKADKIMMAHSLEGRFPFLDKDLFEYVSGIPQDWKVTNDGITKWILKEIMRPHLPDIITKRPKMGFTVPVAQMVKRLKPLLMEVFASAKNSCLSDILNTDLLSQLVNVHYDKNIGSVLQIWSSFVLIYWFQTALPKYRTEGKILPGRNNNTSVKYRTNLFEGLSLYDIRFEISRQFLKGKGIEIGAGASPQRLPDGVVCEYFDKRNADELSGLFNISKNDLKQVYSLGEFWKRFPDGADFLIAHQVLEHTPNPILTLVEWNNYLKDGGVVVISVPDSESLPDKDRLIPPFEHVLSDFILGRSDNSFESREHIYSFLMGWLDNGWLKAQDKYALAWAAHNSAKAKSNDLHWHALDTELFEKIIRVSAFFANRTIVIEDMARPDSIETRTKGDIVYVYRLFSNTTDDRHLNEIELTRNQLLNCFKKINEETAKIINPKYFTKK